MGGDSETAGADAADTIEPVWVDEGFEEDDNISFRLMIQRIHKVTCTSAFANCSKQV